jgi:broad specificity phosphatase PhoE
MAKTSLTRASIKLFAYRGLKFVSEAQHGQVQCSPQKRPDWPLAGRTLGGRCSWSARAFSIDSSSRVGLSGETEMLWFLVFGASLQASEEVGSQCSVGRFALVSPTDVELSCSRSKLLHLIRHAQGEHNAAEEAAEAFVHSGLLRPATDEYSELQAKHGRAWILLESVSGKTYWDPPLTARGREQAGNRLAALRPSAFTIDAVCSSPFRRTLQTAFLALPHMQQGVQQQPSSCATDLLREHVMNFTCDFRSTASSLAKEFPAVNFTGVSEADAYALAGAETEQQLQSRVLRAIEWLLDRPTEQRTLAVVTHRHFLQALTGLFPSLERANVPFENAEHRIVKLCEKAPPP